MEPPRFHESQLVKGGGDGRLNVMHDTTGIYPVFHLPGPNMGRNSF